MDSPAWFEALWAAPRAPKNSMQSCLALNRDAAEMPAPAKAALMHLPLQKNIYYD
jgi:hypothetical protein